MSENKLQSNVQITQTEGQVTRDVLSKALQHTSKKAKVKHDMYTFVGKEMVVYPSWISPKYRKYYWMLILLSSVVVEYYMAFFAVWVGVIILQMFNLDNLLNAYAILAFVGLGCLLVYKALDGLNRSTKPFDITNK